VSSVEIIGVESPLGPIPPGRYGFGGVLASEWTKLKSVRSTVWTLLVTAFVGVGLTECDRDLRAGGALVEPHACRAGEF
jgi:hypothetical protein